MARRATAPLRTEALVLRTFEFSESSLVVWFLTREHGRLHALARGARRPRSDFDGALESFLRCDIGCYRKKGRELDRLAELKLRDLHLPLRRSLERLTCAAYLTELCCETVQLDDPDPELYDLMVTALAGLARGPLRELQSLVLATEGRLLRALGLFPSLERCVACDRVVAEPKVRFDGARGGVLCAEHGEGSLRCHRGSLLSFARLVEGGGGGPVVLARATMLELRRLLGATWRAQLEGRLRSLPALEAQLEAKP
jgi:DNA repair protein RecO (recombination protein O)